MFQCPMCPRQLKSRSGLSGHLQWKHATKLQALKAAPEQLGPAPAKALEAAPGVVPLEHIVDGLECTLYMLDIDVIRLADAIDMQEVNLWKIVTDVEIINAEIKVEGERAQKAMEEMTQGITKLTKDVDLLARSIVQLSEKFETLAANRHPPGFCQKRSCVANCDAQLKELRANTDTQIGYRIAEEKLKLYGLFS